MKANEAPEKIYLSAIDLEEVGHLLTESNDRDDVEYTRTDAFVEKSVNWLRCHPSSHYDDLEEFANAFKKAMKL